MGINTVLAHQGEEIIEAVGPSLTEVVRSNQINYTLVSVVILVILTILAVILNKFSQKSLIAGQPPPSVPENVTSEEPESSGALWKTVLFACMVLTILANSIYLVGSTLYVNAKSITNGPVHWHSDFEVWDCGQEIELIDPIPPSNKVGSPLLHEHNDKEIHVEEAVFNEKDVSIGAFFRVVGGDLHSDYLKMPTNSAVVERRNGDLCPDGSMGVLQVFLYKAGSFTAQKMTDPENYLMTPEQKVPPGDCLIIEFSPLKDQTDKLCQSYEVAKEKLKRGR